MRQVPGLTRPHGCCASRGGPWGVWPRGERGARRCTHTHFCCLEVAPTPSAASRGEMPRGPSQPPQVCVGSSSFSRGPWSPHSSGIFFPARERCVFILFEPRAGGESRFPPSADFCLI